MMSELACIFGLNFSQLIKLWKGTIALHESIIPKINYSINFVEKNILCHNTIGKLDFYTLTLFPQVSNHTVKYMDNYSVIYD